MNVRVKFIWSLILPTFLVATSCQFMQLPQSRAQLTPVRSQESSTKAQLGSEKDLQDKTTSTCKPTVFINKSRNPKDYPPGYPPGYTLLQFTFTTKLECVESLEIKQVGYYLQVIGSSEWNLLDYPEANKDPYKSTVSMCGALKYKEGIYDIISRVTFTNGQIIESSPVRIDDVKLSMCPPSGLPLHID